jgi:hypothetical protein
VLRDDNVKVTPSRYAAASIFSSAAKAHRVSYQRMIRTLMNRYAEQGLDGIALILAVEVCGGISEVRP